ncbi:hypothetical protein [Enterococcus sp. DIV0170]|uniref:hypothetical protein n=1 Tax=Enterococcus sp. DIV0170 TaxID=2774642 RepID=UPI003F2558FE
MMKPFETLEDVKHLVENFDEVAIILIQKYIDHQLLFLQDESTETNFIDNQLHEKEAI